MQSVPFGEFQLLKRINEGDTTELFMASRTDVEGVVRLFAIKRLLPQVVDDPVVKSALEKEARTASNFTHGNIAQVLESGEIEGVQSAAGLLVRLIGPEPSVFRR